jgi:flagellar protein FliO/FliZ
MREPSFTRRLTATLCLAFLCSWPIAAIPDVDSSASLSAAPLDSAPEQQRRSESAVDAAAAQQSEADEPVTAEQPAAEPVAKTVDRRNFIAPAAERPGSGLALSKIVISLALVVTLVFVLGWLFKKLTLRLPGSRQIKVICSLPLGTKERLLVIEMQGKQRVLGVTAHSINMLFELENPLPEEKLASDFHTQLQSLLKK